MIRINKDFVEELKRTFNTARVTLVSGKEGVGKCTGVHMLSTDLKVNLVTVDTKMQGIREFQSLYQELEGDIIYVINNANEMSLNAQNALLKILEEPKQTAHIYLLATSRAGLIETLIRRIDKVVNVYSCSKSDLQLYDKLNFERLQSDFGDDIVNSIDTFSEFEALASTSPTIIEFCNKVINNIRTVSTPNAFKIANSIKLSSVQEGYDLGVFLRVISTLAIKKFRDEHLVDALRVFVASSRALKRYDSKYASDKGIVDLFIVEARSDSEGIK